MKYFITATEILPEPTGRRTSVWIVDREKIFGTILNQPFDTYEEAQACKKRLIDQDENGDYDYEIFFINL